MEKAQWIAIFIILVALLAIVNIAGVSIYNKFYSFELKYQVKDIMKHTPKNDWVCLGYTQYYEEELNKIGVGTQRVLIHVKSEEDEKGITLTGHVFLIAYSEDGYCKIDQRSLSCFKYAN